MKIAYITFKFPTFSETFVQREVNQLIESNINVDVYSIRNPQETEWNIDTNHDIKRISKYHPLDSIHTHITFIRNILSDKEQCRKLTNYILETSKKNIPRHHILAYTPIISCIINEIDKGYYDHIHAHWAGLPTSVAKIASEILGIPYSFTAHAHDIYTNSSINLRSKLKKAKFVITCTQYNKEYLKKEFSPGKIYRNYHGLMPEQYQCTRHRNSQTNIVAGGRFVEKKGFNILIEAISQIEKKEGMKIPCTIFGDGPMHDEIKSVKKRREMDYIELPGEIPHHNVKKLLSNAQVFVAPSVLAENGDRDGIPNVILEAFACGTPAIGSNISGLPEVIIDGQTGWTVQERNVENLSNKILTAWHQPALCADYGEKGRELVERKFDIEENVNNLVSIFKENID